MNKTPGYSSTPVISELDVSYHTRYSDTKIPDAYESLILDILLGDKSNFVRGDELDEAWKIFTPLLHQLEKEKVKPLPYQFGSRGPSTLPPFIEKLGYRRQEDYLWSPAKM